MHKKQGSPIREFHPLGNHEITNDENGQKAEKKQHTAEYHFLRSIFLVFYILADYLDCKFICLLALFNHCFIT